MPKDYVFSTLGNKKVEELVDNIRIDKDGAVTGTLKYVSSWKEFSGNEEQQKGYYFPLRLNDKYSGKYITCTGKNTKKAQELEWVLYVEGSGSAFRFSTDDEPDFLTLSFNKATFDPAE